MQPKSVPIGGHACNLFIGRMSYLPSKGELKKQCHLVKFSIVEKEKSHGKKRDLIAYEFRLKIGITCLHVLLT